MDPLALLLTINIGFIFLIPVIASPPDFGGNDRPR